MLCFKDLIIIPGSSTVSYIYWHHALRNDQLSKTQRQTCRKREGENDGKGSETAETGRCRGRKREREHLSSLLPAEECLSAQAAQYETRSQLQLMVKRSILLRLRWVFDGPLRDRGSGRGRGGSVLIHGRPERPIHAVLCKFTHAAQVACCTFHFWLKNCPIN